MGKHKKGMKRSSSLMEDPDEAGDTSHKLSSSEGANDYRPVLVQSYEDNVRPYIDVIDKLRALGVDEDVNLPTIVAIGDQSSGKSSILEAISGVQLPRGSGIVTRCPLNMQLKRENADWKAELWHSQLSSPVRITSPSEVEDAIRSAQDKLAGPEPCISAELINLKIYSEYVPDLTLIDLPGLVRTAIRDQPRDIRDQIRHIVKTYSDREETIILCVIPLNQDIATVEAYQIAEEVDQEGKRTLGVLTKPDLVEEGKEKAALDTARNEVKKLVKGYTTVKCRSQKDLDNMKSLPAALEDETEFFENHRYFSGIDESNRGVSGLSMKLADELVEHIKRCLPALRTQVKQKLSEANARFHELPEGPPDGAEGQLFLVKIITEFSNRLESTYKEGIKLTRKEIGMEPRSGARTSFGYSSKTGEDEEINSFYYWRTVFSKFQEAIERKTKTSLDGSSGDLITAKIRDLTESQRGRELPRFPNFDLFENLAQKHMKKYQACAEECLKGITDGVERITRHLANKHFDHVPNLKRRILEAEGAVRQRAVERAEKQINFTFEKENLVYAQDSVYTLEVEEREKILMKEKEEQQGGQRMPTSRSLTFMQTGDETDINKNAEVVRELMRCYLTVANRRLCDDIPCLLRICMHYEYCANLQEDLMKIITDRDAGNLLKEEPRLAQRRSDLRKKLHRLTEAKKELDLLY